MSQLKRLSEENCEMEMTPMIDVTFLLLIFFMCTLKFKTLEGKLAAYLPKDVGVNTTQAEPIEKVEIMIRVLNPGNKIKPQDGSAYNESVGGRFVYDSTRQVQYAVGTTKTQSLKTLGDKLTELHRRDPERPATIDARSGVIYADVVKVLDEAIAADFTDITFVGAYPEGTK